MIETFPKQLQSNLDNSDYSHHLSLSLSLSLSLNYGLASIVLLSSIICNIIATLDWNLKLETNQ